MSRSVDLCIEGTYAERTRQLDHARELYASAWEAAVDDYDRCVAAHYIAHLAVEPTERHRWNLLAFEHAQRCGDERVAAFYGSLYVNLGQSYELLGDAEQARAHYALAAEHGVIHEA